MLFGAGGGDHLSASPECARRATELADADGQLQQLELLALNQINRGNVANLKVKFMASLGDPARPNKATEYFTPLVEDGFMYVGNQWHQYHQVRRLRASS